MTKTIKTHKGRKVSTRVLQNPYELYFSRPAKGVKDQITFLSVQGPNPATGEIERVRLDGRIVAQLRKMLTQ
jgi:hypothetical protein